MAKRPDVQGGLPANVKFTGRFSFIQNDVINDRLWELSNGNGFWEGVTGGAGITTTGFKGWVERTKSTIQVDKKTRFQWL